MLTVLLAILSLSATHVQSAVDVVEMKWTLTSPSVVSPSAVQTSAFRASFAAVLRGTFPQATTATVLPTVGGDGRGLDVSAMFTSGGYDTTQLRDELAARVGPLGVARRAALDAVLLQRVATMMAVSSPSVVAVEVTMRSDTASVRVDPRCSNNALSGFSAVLEIAHGRAESLSAKICDASRVPTCPSSGVRVSVAASLTTVNVSGAQSLDVAMAIVAAARSGSVGAVSNIVLSSAYGESTTVYNADLERNKIVETLTCNSSDFIWVVSFVILLPIGYILLQRSSYYGKKQGEKIERAEMAANFASAADARQFGGGTSTEDGVSHFQPEQPPMIVAEVMRVLQALQATTDEQVAAPSSSSRRAVG